MTNVSSVFKNNNIDALHLIVCEIIRVKGCAFVANERGLEKERLSLFSKLHFLATCRLTLTTFLVAVRNGYIFAESHIFRPISS